MVREAIIQDCLRINEIYNQNISSESVANCHLTKTTENYWIKNLSNPEAVFVVSEKVDGKISGWGSIKELYIRSEYKGICELSVYVNLEDQNGMVAYHIYNYLLKKAKERKYKQMVSLVFEKNIRSYRMLSKLLGFVKVVEFKDVAVKSNEKFSLVMLSKKLDYSVDCE